MTLKTRDQEQRQREKLENTTERSTPKGLLSSPVMFYFCTLPPSSQSTDDNLVKTSVRLTLGGLTSISIIANSCRDVCFCVSHPWCSLHVFGGVLAGDNRAVCLLGSGLDVPTSDPFLAKDVVA